MVGAKTKPEKPYTPTVVEAKADVAAIFSANAGSSSSDVWRTAERLAECDERTLELERTYGSATAARRWPHSRDPEADDAHDGGHTRHSEVGSRRGEV